MVVRRFSSRKEVEDLLAAETGRPAVSGQRRILQTAVRETDLTFVCVGTSRNPDGSQNISGLQAAIETIARAIAGKSSFHAVVLRSTVLPGTTRGAICQIMERFTGGAVGKQFGLGNNPEFTREGSAVADFRSPSRIVIGEIDGRTADLLTSIYAAIPAPVSFEPG